MIHFHWPWVLILLPLPWLLTRLPSNTEIAAIDVPPAMETALQEIGDDRRHRITLPLCLLWLCWVLLLLAIAQPWRPGEAVVQPVSGRALALAVDASGSMEREDFSLNGVTENRLSVVKKLAGEFIRQRQGDRISLIIFGKQAFIASPLTFDLASLGHILDSAGIGMAGRSTAIGDAIGLAIQTLQDDPAQEKAIILLSDGTNNAGSVEPESAAALASTLGIRLHTIALGSVDAERSGYQTAQSADLDEATLKAVAERAGGMFFRASSSDDLQQIYTTINTLEQAEAAAPPVLLQQDLRVWPQSLLLLCLLLLAWPGKVRR